MPDLDDGASGTARPTVFLSYASEDREIARTIRDLLGGFGLEVWFDENELGGGEAWDQKIRRQIRECTYFLPLISAQTQARNEGYFRREWRLAVERTLDMADDRLFLLPILIDDTAQSAARVPEKFLTVQWLKVPGGRPTPAFESLCRRIASGAHTPPTPERPAGRREAAAASAALLPEFPTHEPGQTIRFWFEVVAWACRISWARFKRMRSWVRIVVYVWLAIWLLSRCHSSTEQVSADISPAAAKKIEALTQSVKSDPTKEDVVKYGTQFLKTLAEDADEGAVEGSPLLAINFTAPDADPAAQQFAKSVFASVYGTVAISHRGQVSLSKESRSCDELGPALELAKANESAYVLCGGIVGKGGGADATDGAPVLTVKIAKVADGSLLWSRSYPAAGADAGKIAAEVDAKIPPLAAK